jgi:Mannosylglycerate hydrolase MGH1-like glycoside hydrolase domain/Glycosyl hydrolase family 63 C-terminal domain
METNEERRRLAEHAAGQHDWKRWGPYLSERQWGTVREDYSPGGTAWDYFPHDHARSRAYRWGEDGLAGISDDQCRLCLSLALWNGKDPILKERLFGLTNSEGNHGEDVKELYYYLDATPTHSYLKMLYKYPQREFPYAQLIEENRRRARDLPEFELLDTGIFDDDRYFDVFVEYAKAGPEDILMRVTVHNRGSETATIHLLPQLWCRNTWSWKPNVTKPRLHAAGNETIVAEVPALGAYQLCGDGEPELLFCENETNVRRLFGGNDAPGLFKDAFHEYIARGNRAAVNPDRAGTKAGAFYQLAIPAGGSTPIRLRLTRSIHATQDNSAPSGQSRPPAAADSFSDFDAIFARRIREADEFYAELQKDNADADARLVQRQAFAGMIWSKQFFHYDVREWLQGDPLQPLPPPERRHGRNADWQHLNNTDIISMPDKWEYPWYAAWDLAFHTVALAMVDAEFAKRQLVLLTREWYMHPNGQLPAYEWAFGDVNPPVHAWAAWRVFQMDRKQRREKNPSDRGDLAFLERVFHKLMLNFTWWVNRKDAQGRNIFQGGFLGLDNIGVFDRSKPLPTGGFINQADGTSWMAMYCLNLMCIALELARSNKTYEDIATKFFEHFLGIAAAINGAEEGCLGLWDERDEFYYDALHLPDGRAMPLEIRSMVGLIPLFAVETLEPELLKELPEFAGRLEWFLNQRPDLAKLVSRWHECGTGERRLLSLLRGHRMKCLLRRMLDENEFLSDFGVRALSKVHEREPYRLECGGLTHEVRYWPGESENGLFGGNSNWRGPIWMPVNYLIIESLQKFHHYYGGDFQIECPTGSGKLATINEVADELARRLAKLFLPGPDGQRPVLKYHPKLAADPHFKDHILFHEYFHGDTGRGIGASHQTGWTGLVAKLLQPRRGPRNTSDTMFVPRPQPRTPKA